MCVRAHVWVWMCVFPLAFMCQSSVFTLPTILTTHCSYSKSMSRVMLTCRPCRCQKYNRNEFRVITNWHFELPKWSGAKMLLFFFCPQPGSRRPVNGTDEKFGSKEPKPSTLEPVSCISMYLYICLYWRLALPWTLMRRVSLKYRDGFTSSINLESDSSSLWAPWKFRMVHWDFARSHFSFKVHSIPLAHNFT